MILEFPDLETLELVLSRGDLPPEMVLSPARTGQGGRGQLWVETAVSVPRTAWQLLTPLGVQQRHARSVTLDGLVAHWLQLVPLRPQPDALGSVPAAVLFRAADPRQLGPLVQELLLLGNDQLDLAAATANERPLALLRVHAPPLYSVLKVIESDAAGLTVYREHAERCWIEMGWSHSLAHHLQLPPTQVLLVDHQGGWQVLELERFRSLDECLEFVLPDGASEPERFRPAAPWPLRIPVALRLLPTPGDHPPQLWLLTDDPVSQIETLATTLPQTVLEQLQFAICESGSHRIGLLYAPRPLDERADCYLPGHAFAPSPQLKTVFLPAETCLSPPLRPASLRALLALEDDTLTWLTESQGRLQRQSLRRQDLHPLADFVDYILETHSEQLQAWQHSITFDFEDFAIAPDAASLEDSNEAKGAQPTDAGGTGSAPADPPGTRSAPPVVTDSAEHVEERGSDDMALPKPMDTAEALQAAPADRPSASNSPVTGASDVTREERVSQKSVEGATAESSAVAAACIPDLRRQLLDSDLDPDSAAPALHTTCALWKQLAEAHQSRGELLDAAACWREAAWFAFVQSSPGEGWTELNDRDIRAWLTCECGNRRQSLTDVLEQLSATRDDSHQLEQWQAVAIAAALATHLAGAGNSPAARTGTLNDETSVDWIADGLQFLDAYARQIPLRLAWMAWRALARAAGDDALMLARARDRVLQCLHDPGLDPRIELPAFLREPEHVGTEYAAFCEQLEALRETVHQWDAQHESPASAATPTYIDLLFACRYARLGDIEQVDRLVRSAEETLPPTDGVHAWALDAFREHLTHLQRAPNRDEPLRSPAAERLEMLERMDRYKVDRLRAQLVTLEPATPVDPFRQWSSRLDDSLHQRLLSITADPAQQTAQRQVEELLADERWTARQRMQILSACLEVAARGNRAILDTASLQLRDLPWTQLPAIDAARLLLHAVTVSAHLNAPQTEQASLARLQAVLEHATLDADSDLPILSQCLEDTLTRLRRMTSLSTWSEWLTASEALLQLAQERAMQTTEAGSPQAAFVRLISELPLIPARLTTGQLAQARGDLDEAVALLAQGTLSNVHQLQLAVAFLRSLTDFPADARWARIEEFFTGTIRIADRFATRTHFSLSRLRVVEAALLALVPETIVFGPRTTRRLEAREFALRHQLART